MSGASQILSIRFSLNLSDRRRSVQFAIRRDRNPFWFRRRLHTSMTKSFICEPRQHFYRMSCATQVPVVCVCVAQNPETKRKNEKE